MKSKLLKTCWIANIIGILLIMIPFIFEKYYSSITDFLFVNIAGQLIFYLLGSLSLILWGYCLFDIKKRKGDNSDLIFLVLLSALYVPFYYYYFYIKKNQNNIC